MSIKTATKRLALGVIIALGLGLLSAPSSSAVVNNLSVSLGSSSAAVTLGDTASTTITHTFAHTQEIVESATVRYSCVAPTGATCPAILANQTPTSDTANVMVKPANTQNTWLDISGNVLGQVYSGWTDSSTTSSVASVRSVINIKAMQFVTAGTYTYSFYSVSAPNGLAGSSVVQSSTVTWTITASAASTSATAINKKYLSADAFTGMNNRRLFLSSTDSAVSVSAGTATSPTRVAYAYLVLQNANGDTRVAVGDGFKAVQDSVTVTVSGPGLVTTNNDGSTGAAKSATLSVSNSATLYGTETLSILSDGTAGTMTITYSIGTAVLGTHTVTFLGLGASAALSAADTVTYLGTAGTTSVTFSALVKDSAGNQVKSGTFYVFSSDTSIAGAVPTSTGSASRQTSHQCNSYNSTSFLLECSVVLRDTGTATITLRDSWTVSASSWSSNEVTLDIRGNVARYISVSFDKATYAPGEKAIISITAKDSSNKGLATRTGDTGRLSSVISTPVLSQTTATGQAGTQGLNYTDTTFLSYQDSGIETRVVFMPSFGTEVTYKVTIPGFGADVDVVSATASAKVVDPNAALIAAAKAAAEKAGSDAVAAAKAAQAAAEKAATDAVAAAKAAQDAAVAEAKKTADAAVAAADAAADAANEAIDAANAATDAANLSAEAADAATVAAEEARDAADAATAAVEELATQVATLMAALKAQITTLANTVAKIAKKVKA